MGSVGAGASMDCLSPFPHRHFVRAPRSHVHPTATAQAPSHHAADGTHHAQQAIASFDTQAFYYTSLSFLSCGFRLLLSALACLVTLLYRYLLLLGLFHLDSFSIPLDNLAQVIAAEAVAPDDNHAAALAVPHKTWEAYISTIGRDLEMTGALCAAVLALTIGLLSITTIAEEVVTKTISFLCIFACAAGIAISLNMRRHLNDITQLHNAARDWVHVAKLYASSRLTTIPMLLAAPWAWTAWSISFFLVALLSFVWRLRRATLDMNPMQTDSSFSMSFLTMAHNAANINGGGSDQSAPGILSFTWASRIPILLVFVIVIAHFTLTAIYFTKLGFPVGDTDTELGNVPIPRGNAALPADPFATPDGTAAPGPVQAIPPSAGVGSVARTLRA